VVGLLGEPEKIRKLKDGTLLVQAKTVRQASLLLNCNQLGDTSVVCEAHRSLNTKRGIIHCPDLHSSSKELIC
jgi:hypothetical protein